MGLRLAAFDSTRVLCGGAEGRAVRQSQGPQTTAAGRRSDRVPTARVGTITLMGGPSERVQGCCHHTRPGTAAMARHDSRGRRALLPHAGRWNARRELAAHSVIGRNERRVFLWARSSSSGAATRKKRWCAVGEPIQRNSVGTAGSCRSLPASPSFGGSQGMAPWATAKVAAPGEK